MVGGYLSGSVLFSGGLLVYLDLAVCLCVCGKHWVSVFIPCDLYVSFGGLWLSHGVSLGISGCICGPSINFPPASLSSSIVINASLSGIVVLCSTDCV